MNKIDTISPQKFLSYKQAAKFLGVHWQTARNYVVKGKLPSFKVDRRVCIPRESVYQLVLESRRNIRHLNETVQVCTAINQMSYKELTLRLDNLGAELSSMRRSQRTVYQLKGKRIYLVVEHEESYLVKRNFSLSSRVDRNFVEALLASSGVIEYGDFEFLQQNFVWKNIRITVNVWQSRKIFIELKSNIGYDLMEFYDAIDKLFRFLGANEILDLQSIDVIDQVVQAT